MLFIFHLLYLNISPVSLYHNTKSKWFIDILIFSANSRIFLSISKYLSLRRAPEILSISPREFKFFNICLSRSEVGFPLLVDVDYELLNLVAYIFRGKSPFAYSTFLSPFNRASSAYASITSPINRILSPVSISCLTLHSI